MAKKWHLQEAKNKFSEVVDEALHHGPQTVTRHGEEMVIVISVEDFRKLSKPEIRLYDFLRNSPLRGIDLDLKRDKSLPRDTAL